MSAVSAPLSTTLVRNEAVAKYPFYCVRFWHSMTISGFWRLLSGNRWRISPMRIPMAAIIASITPTISCLAGLQRLIYDRAVAATEIKQPPVFIIGHWRSGTTYLHELMSLDERFGWPTTYEVFASGHWLLTESWMRPLVWPFIPRNRPMDNMELGWDKPQEDEFAMIGQGAPTPYYRMAFPNEPAPYMEFFDMRHVKPADLKKFREAMLYFVKCLNYRHGKRLLLKSPPHTGRIEFLSELFPGAKFVHITRHPDSLFSSTTKLWDSLDSIQGFQLNEDPDNLRRYVFAAFERMYSGFEDQRQRVDPANVVDVKYEELVKDPATRVGEIYERLGLGDYGAVRPKIETYHGERKNYRTNKHELDGATKAEIRRRWKGYFEKYGYE